MPVIDWTVNAQSKQNRDEVLVDKYFQIRVNSLIPDRPTSFDLFVLINKHYVLYMRAGDRLKEDKIKNFENRANDVFFVKESERQLYKDYVHTQVNDSNLPAVQRAIILRESSYSLVEELFEQPDVNVALNDSKQMIHQFIEFMDQEPDSMAHLIGLSSHDFYTYNHSLDVSIYCLGLGSVVGFSSVQDLADLGRGSLFHDIGKRHVSADIICKKGPLDDVEWAQMKRHPAYGLRILHDNQDVSDAIRACVFEHHENHMGNGYPQELKGPDIHPMARIVALCDTYDALTTKRSYNEPMSPSNALTLMKDKLAGRFDPELLKAMYSVLFKMKAS